MHPRAEKGLCLQTSTPDSNPGSASNLFFRSDPDVNTDVNTRRFLLTQKGHLDTTEHWIPPRVAALSQRGVRAVAREPRDRIVQHR